MMKYIKGFIWVVLLVMFIDAFGFISWSISGQKPVDDFYAGIITKTIISNLIK